VSNVTSFHGGSADDPSRSRILSRRRLLWVLSMTRPPASGVQRVDRSFVDGQVDRRDVQTSASTSESQTRRNLRRLTITFSTYTLNGDSRELHEWSSSTGEGHHNTTRQSRSPSLYIEQVYEFTTATLFVTGRRATASGGSSARKYRRGQYVTLYISMLFNIFIAFGYVPAWCLSSGHYYSISQG